MAKQAQFVVARPCKTLDSPALWDWLERYHPEMMSRFNIVFSQEVERRIRGMPSQYHKLSEHIRGFAERSK